MYRPYIKGDASQGTPKSLLLYERDLQLDEENIKNFISLRRGMLSRRELVVMVGSAIAALSFAGWFRLALLMSSKRGRSEEEREEGGRDLKYEVVSGQLRRGDRAKQWSTLVNYTSKWTKHMTCTVFDM